MALCHIFLSIALFPLGSNVHQEDFPEQRWLVLESITEIEAWIDNYNRELQECLNSPNASGYGVRFTLEHGGHIYLHTNEEAIWLDVTPEAEWAGPVITAATGVEAPRSQIWALPPDKLTELIMGLNMLITSTRLVTHHAYRIKKW
jgi:hypothetical protein